MRERERESVKEETGGFFLRGFNRKGMKTKTGIGKEKIEREGNSFEQKELFLFLIFCCFLSNEFFSAPMNFFSPSFILTFHFKILTPERKSTQARRRKKIKIIPKKKKKTFFERRWRAKEKN